MELLLFHCIKLSENIKNMVTRFSPVPNWMDVTIKPHIRPFKDQRGGGRGKIHNYQRVAVSGYGRKRARLGAHCRHLGGARWCCTEAGAGHPVKKTPQYSSPTPSCDIFTTRLSRPARIRID
jgi:hypothetical protein